MPRLEGVRSNTEVIRTYSIVRVSRFNLEQSRALDVASRAVRQCVMNICSGCVNNGYYIIGLNRGDVDINEGDTSYAVEYTLSVELRVRRFLQNLTNDERYYYSKQGTDQLLFEIAQLYEVRGLVLDKSATLDVSGSFITADKIYGPTTEYTVSMDPASVIDLTAETGVARAIAKQEVARQGAAKQKVQKYKIIKRPKCSLTSG